MKKQARDRLLLIVPALALTAGIVCVSLLYHKPLKEYLQSGGAGPAVFILLMGVLPLAGFPVSVFLFLAGMQFGLLRGIGLTALIMALHLPLTFVLTHTLMRRPVESLLSSTRYDVPRFEGNNALKLAFVFMAVPGLSYTLKNVILAFSGIPFKRYFALAWPVNLALSIPFIGLGKSLVRNDIVQVLFFAALIVLLFAGVKAVKHSRKAE